MTRRILYYQTIMNRDSREITKRIVQLQKEEHNEGTFYQQVESDMIDLNISEDDLSHTVLKKQLQDATAKLAFQHLIDMARKHSKTKDNIYHNLQGMAYFDDPRFTANKARLLFKFRTRMFNVRNNFRNQYTSILCPLCHRD